MEAESNFIKSMSEKKLFDLSGKPFGVMFTHRMSTTPAQIDSSMIYGKKRLTSLQTLEGQNSLHALQNLFYAYKANVWMKSRSFLLTQPVTAGVDCLQLL